MKQILVVAAHPDDEILGLGGTVKKHVNDGDEVYALILGEGMTSRNDEDKADKLKELHEDVYKAANVIGFKEVYLSNFPDNRFDSVDLLDIIHEIERYVDKLNPEIIYTHHPGDLNIDHKITFKALITACRPVGDYNVKKIIAFETPSSTEWNYNYNENTFNPNYFVDIEDTLEAKIKAMETYKTEIRDYPHPRSSKALKVIASRWGTTVGKNYVEAFEIIREVKD